MHRLLAYMIEMNYNYFIGYLELKNASLVFQMRTEISTAIQRTTSRDREHSTMAINFIRM
jgi:hypothetical protein